MKKNGCAVILVFAVIAGLIGECSSKFHKKQELILPTAGFFQKTGDEDPDIWFQTFYNQTDCNLAFIWKSGRTADMYVKIKNGNELYDYSGARVGYIIVKKDGSFKIKGSITSGGHYVSPDGAKMSYKKREKKDSSKPVVTNPEAKVRTDDAVFEEEFFCDSPYLYEQQKQIADKLGFTFFATEGKMGLRDRSEKTIIGANYDRIKLTEDGKYAIVVDGEHLGFFSTDGREILPAQYDFIRSLREESTSAGEGDEGYVPSLDTDPYLYVRKDKKYGVVDKGGHFICELKYREIVWPDSPDVGKWICQRQEGVDIVDFRTRTVKQIKCEESRPSMDAYCSIRRGGKWGVVDSDGELVIDTVYDEIPSQSERIMYCLTDSGNKDLAVIKNGKYGIIDLHGGVLVPFEYDYISTCPMMNESGESFRQLFVGKNDDWSFDGKWGLYKNGKIVAPCTHSAAEVSQMIWS